MKKVKLLLGLSFLLILGACSSNPNDAIKGNWKLTEVKFGLSSGEDLNEDQKALSDNLSKDVIADKTSIEFKDNETFSKTSKGNTEKGTYTAVELDGNIEVLLVSDDVNASPTKMTISSLTESEMVTKFDIDDKIYAEYIYTKK